MVDPVEGIDATLDVRIDNGVIAAVGERARHERASRRRRGRARARTRVRRSARAPAHARPRGRGDDRERLGGRRGRRLLRDPRDAEHRPGRRLGGDARRARRDRAQRRGDPRRLHGGDHARAERASSSPTWASSPTQAPRASRTTASPSPRAGPHAARAPVRVDHRPPARAPLRGAVALARRPRARGTRSRPSSASRRYPSVGESVMVERDLALAAYEEQPLHLLHLSAAESVAALRRAREAGVAASGEVTPHHLVLTDERGPLARPEREDEPAAARRAGPRRARRGAARRHDRGDRNRSRTARAPREGGAVRGGAVRRHRPRDGVRRPLQQLVEPGLLPLATLLERMSAGPARIFGLERPRVAAGARANLVLLDPSGSGRSPRGRLPVALGELVAPRPHAQGTRRMTVAGGAVVFE